MEHCCTLVSIVTAFDSLICLINSVIQKEGIKASNLSENLRMGLVATAPLCILYPVCVCFWNWWLLLHLVFWCSVLRGCWVYCCRHHQRLGVAWKLQDAPWWHDGHPHLVAVLFEKPNSLKMHGREWESRNCLSQLQFAVKWTASSS